MESRTVTPDENRVIRESAEALESEHWPLWASEQAKANGRPPVGCEICFPKDGSWPCVTRMVADDLRKLIDD